MSRFRMIFPIMVLVTTAVGFWAGTALAVEHHGAPPGDINWWWGIVSTQADLDEPNLFFRPEGMPAPVLAFVINAALLFGAIAWFGHKPIQQAMKDRRDRIMTGMDVAAAMKAEAAEQLASHQAKLDRIEDEIERLKTEMREATEAERMTVLREAKDRCARMLRDAHNLVKQELKATRQTLMRETVNTAFAAARDILERQASATDQQRIADEYVGGLEDAVQKVLGGRAA